MLHLIQKPVSCRDLLADFQHATRANASERIIFHGVEPKDVYNITAPFEDEGELVIAGRVELRSEQISDVIFFIKRGEAWVPRAGARTFRLQDPFVTRIHGELVFGGVEFYLDNTGKITSWRTNFFKGQNIANLKAFACGPLNMKDIRPVELQDGRVGVFTRPHGLPDAWARIGYTEIDHLDQLNESVIARAELFCDQFRRMRDEPDGGNATMRLKNGNPRQDEWGGSNEAHLLKNGNIGVLGHISYLDDEGMHYHAMAFVLNPKTKEKSPIWILANRRMFPEGPAKSPDLLDVVFAGGLVRGNNGSAWLYAGVSDAYACRVQIPDPFLKYEHETA